MNNLKNLLCMLCLAVGVTVVFAGCMAQDPVSDQVENNSIKITKDGDKDGDGFVPGELEIFVQQKCEFPDSESLEDLCIETVLGALQGGFDCDNEPGDDPAVCPQIDQSGVDCTDPKYSVCAKCINTSADEVMDGVDNDCNGMMLAGECGDDADCLVGQECLDNVCVQTDVCAGVLCGDGNDCTDDFCDPATGNCVNAPDNTNVCDDNSLCTVDEECKGGVCVGTDVDCDDANVCTNDACVPDEGCVHVNNTVPCNDGNACTTADACAGGFCTGGTAPDCDDANACTVDSCDPATGCTNTVMACNDGLLCTDDSCDPATGCINALVDCDDANACTTDSCNPIAGDCINNPIPGCAATCNPAHDAGGEKFGDCAPFTPANFNNVVYGWGCLVNKCVQYEDMDGDEWAGTAESICSDGVDGDLDGLVDCLDPNCFGIVCPQCVKNADCDDANPNTVDSCVLGVCEYCVMQCTGKECGSNGCNGSCGNCGDGEVCDQGLCVAIPPAPASEGSNCGDGLDNDLDGLTDCQDPVCNGIACAAGKTCQAGVCAVTPPVQDPPFVTITVEAPVATEAWIYGAQVVKSGLTTFTTGLSKSQACTVNDGDPTTIDGVEIAAVLVANWGWYGCNPGTPELSTLVVKINGVVVVPQYVKHPWVCGWNPASKGNLVLTPAQFLCP